MPDDQTLDHEDDPIDPEAHAALKAELAQVKVDNAMLAAGIDLESATGKMFRKAWDGDPDVEKIKSAAAEIPGAIKAAPEPAPADGDGEPDREAGEATQFAERAALTSEGAAGVENPDPRKGAFEGLDEALAGGARFEDASADALRSLVGAANAGDRRVMVSYDN